MQTDITKAGERTQVITINPECKLELVASKNSCRPQIENIKLDHSKRFGNVAVATNGRAMAIVPVKIEDEEKPSGLVSPEALKASRKNKPLAGIIMLNGKLELPGGTSFPRPQENEGEHAIGVYPKWEQVLPEPGAKIAFTVAFNPELLLNLARAIGAQDGVTLRFIDEMSPIQVSSGNSQGALGVLMPMRIRS